MVEAQRHDHDEARAIRVQKAGWDDKVGRIY